MRFAECHPERKHKARGYCQPCYSREQSGPYIKNLAARRRIVLNLVKTTSGCVDCGFNGFPGALQFDHTGPDKVNDLAKMVTWNYEKIFAEVMKCEVVCANCHALRTHLRKGGTL